MDIRVPKIYNKGPFMPKLGKVGPFLSIKCLNKGPWKEGAGHENFMQR